MPKVFLKKKIYSERQHTGKIASKTSNPWDILLSKNDFWNDLQTFSFSEMIAMNKTLNHAS